MLAGSGLMLLEPRLRREDLTRDARRLMKRKRELDVREGEATLEEIERICARRADVNAKEVEEAENPRG